MAVGVVFAVAIAVAFAPGARSWVSTVMALLFIRIFAGRLHDLGRTGWWQLVLYALQVIAAIAGSAAHASVSLILGLLFVIHVAFIAVLGAIPGEREANHFGPPPGGPSPNATADVSR